MDILIAATLLPVFFPVLAIAAVTILVIMGWPVFHRQQRIGLRNRQFTLLKLRTMTDKRGPTGTPLPDAERLTALGRFLRTYSLDELPQLWNVLKGDMSLVGPRPLFAHYLPRYTPFQRRRHEVRPGITGWAQVNGRNALTWEQRFELDVWYVDNWSLGLDLKILWLTLCALLRREGISQPGHVTMPEFPGSSQQ
jgi:lipopolysaccharide/colanic/teichoic acid biosynthesis glycosyltransferase